MYVAEQFSMPAAEALRVAADRGVGDLITCGERGIDVTMLPFVLLPDDGGPRRLTTHIARTNLQWQDEGSATWVVHGPDTYISPTVMPTPTSESRMPTVPTWNYLVVHLTGQLIVHHDDDWKLQSLSDLVARHEPSWRLTDGPVSAIRRLLPAIVGLEFVIEQVIGKAKLSQNKSSSDLTSIAATLAATGHSQETAELMRQLALPYIEAREQRVAQARELKIRRAGDK